MADAEHVANLSLHLWLTVGYTERWRLTTGVSGFPGRSRWREAPPQRLHRPNNLSPRLGELGPLVATELGGRGGLSTFAHPTVVLDVAPPPL